MSQAAALSDGRDAYDEAVSRLLAHLAAHDYRFVTPNRGAHRLVSRRRATAPASLLRDVFGWVRLFQPDDLPPDLYSALDAADLLDLDSGGVRSRIRVSTVGDLLLAHSAPGEGTDSVFLGPDSYRYARFLRQTLSTAPVAERALDIGVGAGAGALTILAGGYARKVIGSDVNPAALRLAELNAAHAGLDLQTRLCSGLPPEPEPFDLIVANPPFIAGSNGATYRDGGELYGAALALSWARDSLARLSPGGRFVLYTGAPIVDGRDLVLTALATLADEAGLRLVYEEIDPDIFGSSLNAAAYADVERIAAIGAVIS